MTTQEFSDQFDVLYNNITSNQAPGLNEYEKSLFLTKAQDEIVKNYFTPKGNLHQDGFDNTPKRQHDFSSIIRIQSLSRIEGADRFDQRALVYEFPEDLFLVLNEQLMVDNIPYVVRPISFAEYDRLISKPYKYPAKYQAWRLITNEVENDIVRVEIIGKFSKIPTYRMRYIKKLKPIILIDLSGLQSGLSIKGETVKQTSELPEELHEEILQRAVELAKAAWTATGQDNTQLVMEMGKRSE